jgi:hypothetical protein
VLTQAASFPPPSRKFEWHVDSPLSMNSGADDAR